LVKGKTRQYSLSWCFGKAQGSTQGSLEAGRRAARQGDDYAMLGGVRVTWSYVASCRYLRTLFAEGRRTRGVA
jgi:hypothetical protein